MKTISFSLILIFGSVGLAGSPIKSKEDVQFVARAEDELLFITKTKDFVGAYHRPFESETALRIADLYSFAAIQETRMDEKVCAAVVEKIFGPPKEITLKTESMSFFKGHTGNTCEVSVVDPTEAPKWRERRVIAGFLGAKAYAVVFKLKARSTPQIQEGARKFWSSLR